MAQELKLNQRLGQFLTQQQLRFVRLLEMNAPELDDEVERELEANPALDVAEPGPESDVNALGDDATPVYLRRANNNSADVAEREFAPVDNEETLYDHLQRQISEQEEDPQVVAMAEYITGNLDSNGYLRRSLDMMLEDMAYNHDTEVPRGIGEKALALVRSLDPAGVGADNLRDCLLLQLRRLPKSVERDDAIEILSRQFEAFSMRHSHKIITALHINKERIDAANDLILTLNPKPGAAYGGEAEAAAGVIVPDFIVSREEGELYISLNNRYPELAVEESFAEAMRGMERRRGRPRKGTEFVSSGYSEARDFINVLKQRQQTMLAVMTAIVEMQREYFETADVYTLRPMMLKDIKRITGFDESVVSRATANKYVAMPWGAVVALRSFFSAEVNSEGKDESVTNRKIEAKIRSLVDAEDKRHPLSDEKLREALKLEGYDISRRTIAKYRDRQGILVARLRKEL